MNERERACDLEVVVAARASARIARAPIDAVAQLEALSNQSRDARVVLTALAGRTAKQFIETAWEIAITGTWCGWARRFDALQ